jgi:Ca2+-binding EF-hand superfamily protein
MYGACVATSGDQEEESSSPHSAEAVFALADDSKDGKLSAQEFVEATAKFPQVRFAAQNSRA